MLNAQVDSWLYKLLLKIIIIRNYLFVSSIVLILSGCVSNLKRLVTLESYVKTENYQSNSKLVPHQTKIKELDFHRSLKILVSQMLDTREISIGSSLLIDSIKNNTNGMWIPEEVTFLLRTIIQKTSHFHIVTEARLENLRKRLGLSPEDSFNSRSKAIGLARILNAQYLLHCDFRGDMQSPRLDMQIILVKTGEIVWSGSDTVISLGVSTYNLLD